MDNEWRELAEIRLVYLLRRLTSWLEKDEHARATREIEVLTPLVLDLTLYRDLQRQILKTTAAGE